MSSLHHLQSRSIKQPGIMPYQPVNLDLTSMVRETLRYFNREIRQKNITVSTNFIRPEFVMADQPSLRLILRQLIRNAICNTPVGGTIGITADSDSCDGERDLRISDSGTGISEEALNCINKSIPVDSTPVHLHGMLLCKELTMLNMGLLWAYSMPGSGTDVGITLPVAC